jgi:hypothetical protein
MDIHLSPSDVSIDGHPLAARVDAAAMSSLAGKPVRTSDIAMHPGGIRRVHVSASGVVWYVDFPEARTSHFHLALSRADTPGEPEVAFAGSIRLDSLFLDAGISEATLLRRASVQLEGHIHSWSYRTATHYVSFCFARPRNRIGKRSGAHKLAFVSISFGTAI